MSDDLDDLKNSHVLTSTYIDGVCLFCGERKPIETINDIFYKDFISGELKYGGDIDICEDSVCRKIFYFFYDLV